MTVLVWNDNMVLIARLKAVRGESETNLRVDSEASVPEREIRIYYRM